MALTSAEKYQAVRLLGYPNKTLDVGSVDYSKIIADRLTSLAADAETQTRAMLTRVTALDTKLDAALDRLAAKQVDSIITNPDEIPMLKSERRRIIRELGQTLDLAVLGGGGMMVGIRV